MERRDSVETSWERYRRERRPADLAAVFEATAPELARVACLLSPDRDQAEDLLQTTYLVAMEQADDHDGERSVLPWLLGILANRARRRRRERRDRLAEAPRSEATDPRTAAEGREFQAALSERLERLGAPYREVLALHLLHGLTAKEVAAALGRSSAVVRTQIGRGLERLRRALPSGFAGGLLGLGVSSLRLDVVRAGVLSCHRPSEAGTLGNVLAPAHPWARLGGRTMTLAALLLGAGVVLQFPILEPRSDASPEPSSRRVASPSVGDVTPDPGRRPALRPGRVSGEEFTARRDEPIVVQVWSREVGVPAVGVLVRARALDAGGRFALVEQLQRSDEQGRCRFPRGQHHAWEFDACPGGRDRRVAADHADLVELTVPEGVEVRGRVIDDEGAPVADATIWLPPDRGGGVSELFAVAHGDEEGLFELHDVDPRRWIAASAAGHEPSSLHLLGASAGEVEEVELRLTPGGADLRGVVVDDQGQPVGGAAVQLGTAAVRIGRGRGPMMLPVRYAWSDPQGRFEILGVHAHEQTVWLRAPGHCVTRRPVSLEAGEEQVLSVELARGATVSGVATGPSGEPLAAATIHARQELVEPRVGMGYSGPEWARRATTTDDEGRYVLDAIAPGAVRMTAEQDADSVASTFSLEDRELREWNPQLRSDGSIVGVLRDEQGEPISGWEVWALSQVRGVRDPDPAQTDVEGRFALAPCQDAEYRVGFRPQGSLLYRSALPERLLTPADSPLGIVVPRDRIADAWITGTILDAAGQPAEGVRFSLLRVAADGTTMGAGVPPLGPGPFRVGPLIPGRWLLTAATATGQSLELGAHELAAGATVDAGTHRLPVPGHVVVEAYDETGAVVDGMPFVFGDGAVLRRGMWLRDESRRSPPLAPGLVRVYCGSPAHAKQAQDVEIVAGQDRELRFDLRSGIPCEITTPALPQGADLRIEWFDEAGLSVWLSGGSADEPSPAWTRTEHFLPGRYRVVVRDRVGGEAEATMTVPREGEEPFVIPVPGG